MHGLQRALAAAAAAVTAACRHGAGFALPPALFAGPDGIFAALAVHLAHKARGVAVEWRPNTVWGPEKVDALNLQVKLLCCKAAAFSL